MNEDKCVMDMVNSARDQKQRQRDNKNFERQINRGAKKIRVRALWRTVTQSLMWLGAGGALTVLMLCGQIAIWLAAIGTWICTLMACIRIDRFLRWE